MSGYLGNFFEHAGQITSFASAFVVWLAFGAIGAVVGGGDRMPEATPIYGWALVSFAFTAVGVFTSLEFTWVVVALAALAIVEAVVVVRGGDSILPAGSLRMAVLAAPLLLLVSAMAASQWDEFADWLISPRQVLQLDRFPDGSNKNLGGSLAAYPYGWHIVTYLVSRLAGRLVENAGALINVFLLLTFGLVIVRLIQEGLGKDSAEKPGWGLFAVGGLLVTLVNPTFAQKVALTSYADVAAGVTVGFGGVLGWRMLAAQAHGAGPGARRLAFEFGLVMLVLVNLKQATVALFGLVVGAIMLTGLCDPKIRFRDLVRLLPAMALPGITIYVVWRFYAITELKGGELSVRPFDAWLIGQIPLIAWKMIVVLSKKGLYLALMAAAIVFAARGAIRLRTPLDRLAVIVGAVFVGYNAFLLFAYVTTFGKTDALRVASLWRYNMHMGPLGLAFAAYGLAMLWRRYAAPRLGTLRLAWLPILLILAAPLGFADKLRFDRNPPVPYFRQVGQAVSAMLKPGDRLLVLDPKGSGESAVITRFELKDATIFKGYLGQYHRVDRATYQRVFFQDAYTAILVHSFTLEMLDVLGEKLAPETSYLMVKNAGGGWTVARSWQRR